MSNVLVPDSFRRPLKNWYINGYAFCSGCNMALDKNDCISTGKFLQCGICKQKVRLTPKHKCGELKNREVQRID